MNKRDTSKEAMRVVDDLYRSMSYPEKAKLIFEACQFGKSLAIAGLRQRHPDASDEEIRQLWARQVLGSELYEQAYGEDGYRG